MYPEVSEKVLHRQLLPNQRKRKKEAQLISYTRYYHKILFNLQPPLGLPQLEVVFLYVMRLMVYVYR